MELTTAKKVQIFFLLFQKCRDFLTKSQGKQKISPIGADTNPASSLKLPDLSNIDRGLVLITFLWYLQKRGVFKDDKNFFITQFTQNNAQKHLTKGESYYPHFIGPFLETIFASSPDPASESSLPHIGNFLLIDQNETCWVNFSVLNWADDCYYNAIENEDSLSDIKPSLPSLRKKIPQNLSIFSMLILQERICGEIDHTILGGLFEKILPVKTKQKTGAFYTPKWLCDYLGMRGLGSLLDVNFGYQQEMDIIEWIESSLTRKSPSECQTLIEGYLKRLYSLKILDPAVGSGHFISSIVGLVVKICGSLWKCLNEKKMDLATILPENYISNGAKSFPSNLTRGTEANFQVFSLTLISHFIIPYMIYTVDINPFATIITKLRLYAYACRYLNGEPSRINEIHPYTFNIKTGNSLVGFNWGEEFSLIFKPTAHRSPGFDLIIGNPPYGNLLSPTQKQEILDYASYPNEISSVFIERMMNLTAPQGNLVFITTYAICFNKNLSTTRLRIIENYDLCKIATFDRDKCYLFEGMTQSVSILECINYRRDEPGEKIPSHSPMMTTNMFRQLPPFTDLNYFDVKPYLLSEGIGSAYEKNHRVPKIGYTQISDMLGHLLKIQIENSNGVLRNVGTLIENFKIVRDEKVFREICTQFPPEIYPPLWVRISGNYWYNAWDRVPYFGTQIAFIPIKESVQNLLSSQDIQRFLLILINSSFYYVWFRIYSDGRHMNADILRGIPLPKDFSSKIVRISPYLTVFAPFLMKTLFKHFDSVHNRFNSSKIKETLDICDILIGSIYNLSLEEIQYVQNFESSIRTGVKIPKNKGKSIFSLICESTLKNCKKFQKLLEQK